MPSTAIHDFFRFIKLYSPDGSTLEQTLEADSVTDSLNVRRSDGVSWNVPGVAPGGTVAVTVGFATDDGKAQGNYYINGVEKDSVVLTKGQTYIFDQSDASNAGYGGYNHPLVFSNTPDGAVSGAISGQEYTTGVTYLIDDAQVSKTDYKLNFTSTTNRKVKIELNDSAPTTFYYGSHDTPDQGGSVTTTSGSDLMQINVDYTLDVPPGTTNIELTDINSNTTHVELSATGGITLVRKNANEIEIGSFAVAETDTLHTVSTRNSITTNKLYIENIEIGNVTSATLDGFQSPSAEFIGTGLIDQPLRLAVAEREISTNTITKTFTFTAQNAPGILHYTVGHQLDSGTSATSVSTSIQRFNGVTWDTLDTVSGIGGIPYEVSNMYNDVASSSQYRVVYAVAGNTGTITLELQAFYEILEITENPVIRTDTAVGTVWTRDLAPLGINDIGRGSEPYDNVYANIFHGHLQGTFDGDVTGSVFTDGSTLLVDAINGIIYGTVDANIDRGTNPFTLDADSATIEVARQNDIILRSLGNTDNAQISITGDTELAINSGNGTLSLSSLLDVTISAGEDLTLSAVNGININNPVNTVIFGTAGFVGDLTGSVFGPDSTTVINNNGVVTGTVNTSQVTTANLEASYFTDTVGTIQAGVIDGFSVQSSVYGTDGSTQLVDVANNQIVGEVNADTNRTGTLTVASDTGIDVNGTGAITIDGSSIALNGGVGVDTNGKLVNSSNAAQPFSIASPVTPEKEFRAVPGMQYNQFYTNVTTGVYDIDSSTTENVYWNQPSGALIANITNLETTTQKLRIIRIFINQGGTAFVPSIEINGVTQAFVNLGAVSGTVNAVNVFEFMFYRTHTSTWEVYCSQVDTNSLTLDTITGNGATTTNPIEVGGVDAGSGNVVTTGSVIGGNSSLGNIQIGVTGLNEIDTVSGSLTLDSTDGTVTVDDNLIVTGNATFQGNTFIGNAATDTITIQTTTGVPLNSATVTGYMEITINGTTRYVPYYT
jgi:hypothetical protein